MKQTIEEYRFLLGADEMLIIRACALTLALAVCLISANVSDANDEKADQQRAALQKLNGAIGQWRGVGQPRRGSNRGAWRQTGEWIWDFSDGLALTYQVQDGKLVDSARLTYDTEADHYLLTVTSPEAEQTTYSGNFDDDRLVLTSQTPVDETGTRITLTPLNEKRLLVLHETREAGRETFFRTAEVGYTRQGTKLALPGGGQPECIVTGGAGTMEVQHDGETYYVCCTGCKQAFEDDPEGIIADAEERWKKEKAKSAQ